MMAAQLQRAGGAASSGASGVASGLAGAAATAAAATDMPMPATSEEPPLCSRVSESSSPYVRAQANTPVNWQLLDQEAIDRAKRENKLIFLNIGFLACHYCHTTTQDSFSSPAVAEILNTSFIPIVVDREERPDIDAIYWNYLQLVNSSAGWPINVFLTPELEPVFGGTYWPGPGSEGSVRDGQEDGGEDEMIGFLGILKKLRQSWTDREAQCREEARETVVQLRKFAAEGTLGPRGLLRPTVAEGAPYLSRDLDLDIDQLDDAYTQLKKTFDPVNGGFGVVPKFVTPAKYSFLLKLGSFPNVVQGIIGDAEAKNAVQMALFTLRKLQDSGLHDHLRGGFSRASHTINWTLPHFEKLVPDNALLLSLYLDAWLYGLRTSGTGAKGTDAEFADVVYALADYLSSSPIRLEGGGFASSEAADSYYRRGDNHTREGAYYVWTRREFDAVVGGQRSENDLDTRAAAAYWNVLEHGNVDREDDPNDEFINQNVLYVNKDASEVARQFGISRSDVLRVVKTSKKKLAAHREKERVRPAADRKVTVANNGVVIAALARVGAVLVHGGFDPANGEKYISAARSAARFIKANLWDVQDKCLFRTYSYGQKGTNCGFAEDYAVLIEGLLELYEATGELEWLQWADQLQQRQIEQFYDGVDMPPTSSHSASGGFYRTSEHEPFNILRIKDGMDTTLPATNGVAASNLFRLGSLLGDEEYSHLARETIHSFEVEMLQHSWLFPTLLSQIVSARLGGLQFASVAAAPSAADPVVAEYFRRPRAGLCSLLYVAPVEANGTDDAMSWLRARNPALAALPTHLGGGSYVLQNGTWRKATLIDLTQTDEANEST
ncbi:duf255 domain containing protein [Grosmannia clavigera kw1407]|uniref:Duf255 domain containing protein n=1 Tax=Grosmannia clavigera (strain kw1407 / UAMH 11150) TaxID=655863 RepID=F0XK88_GROCL|nr:duf255 domain containing protein [Grosmannia clavigera kw1407]EFX01859.1 duf255 domain containing protein [Grosmannia clavigera kw1407]